MVIRSPQSLLQSDAQRQRGAVYKWHTPDRSHVEMALRRQHAREARLIQRRVEHDPFFVDTGVGADTDVEASYTSPWVSASSALT